MKNPTTWLSVVVVLLLVSPSTKAAPLYCEGKLYAVLIYKDGIVSIGTTYRNDYTIICSLNTERQGVSVRTCALWAAALQKAKLESRIINVSYDTDSSFSSCGNIPTNENSPAPFYVGF